MKKISMKKIRKSCSLEEAFQQFIRHCKVKNLAPETIKYYHDTYQVFCSYYGDINLNEINEELIEEYVISLQENPNTNDVSVNTRLRGIRVFLYYLMEKGFIERFKISFIRSGEKIKRTFTDQELEVLLKKPIVNNCGFGEYRTWVIINHILATGNRAATIINLTIEDFDFVNGVIILRKVKNRRQQIIPFSHKLSQILREYLEYRNGEADDFMYCNINGEQLTYNALRLSVQSYNLKRGVSKTSIHGFRHTFAKKWILAGGDIFRLQKILGHRSLDMVKEYVEMFDYDMMQDYDKFNALSQIDVDGDKKRISIIKE